MKTSQELFDTTVRHLAKQGRRAERKRPEGSMLCVLRSDDGQRSCAIGCHIPDDVYTPDMENKIGALALDDIDPDVQDVLHAAGVGEDSVGLMATLQHVHDRWLPHLWHRELRLAGVHHCLHLVVFDEPDVIEAFAKINKPAQEAAGTEKETT